MLSADVSVAVTRMYLYMYCMYMYMLHHHAALHVGESPLAFAVVYFFRCNMVKFYWYSVDLL